MRLSFFETENRKYYSASLWVKDYCEELFFSTKFEAVRALENMKKQFPDYTDAYVHHYDENGCAIF